MNSISPDTLRRILSAGGLLSAFYAPENTCGDAVPHLTQLITDSRSLYDAPSTIFAAIRTEVNDGRRYIRDMYLRGVRTFIVDELPDDAAFMDEAFFLLVSSMPEALRSIALYRLENHGKSARRVIVTGSYGKTSVKELLYMSLIQICDARRSPRSWNSGLGVSLAVWDMTAGDKAADVMIIEAGIDGPGQASRFHPLLLGADVGIITPITDEHDINFNSHSDKIREKIELVRHCRTIIYDSSDPETGRLLAEMADPAQQTLRPVNLSVCGENTPTVLHAEALEALSALGHGFKAHEMLGCVPHVSTRIDVDASAGNNIIVYDNFTADLRSLHDALDFTRRRHTATHSPLLILGDLLHRPMDTAAVTELYSEALDMARRFGIAHVIAIGREIKSVSSTLSSHYPGFCDFLADAAGFMEKYPAENFSDKLILLKGRPEDNFELIRNSLENAAHDSTVEVDLDALVHNYNYYRRQLPAGTKMVAMVKASAYGMGSLEVAKTLQSQGATYLAVAVVDEGVALRRAGITMPVIILNPVTNRYRSLFAYNLEPTVFSTDELERLIAEAGRFGAHDYPVHIKFDTGMHRVGFLESDIDNVADILLRQQNIKVSSVFTHLATADCLDMDGYTRGQIDMYSRIADRFEKRLGHSFLRHYLNTAGITRFAGSGRYDMVRLGIGLYGISPYGGEDERRNLRPVARLSSVIISLKHWPAGTPIGYGCRGVTSRDSIIATVPLGYADGINRHMGRGASSFVVRGTECPTIGNICMDLCMVDVTDAAGVQVGDRVEIFGQSMPVERQAEVLDTIPYEILTSVSPRVKRLYFHR